MTVCALVGAAPFNAECFRERLDANAYECVIAVDGGLAHLESIGCVPDVVLGDFDSLGHAPEGLPDWVEVYPYPTHKDESDMELALRLVQERGFDEVAVYAAIGGRLDHTLANLQLFASFNEQGLHVEAIDLIEEDAGAKRAPQDAVARIGTALTFLTGPAELVLEPYPGETVSVFSMSDESSGVTETGFSYLLDHVVLTNRTSWGLSNEFTDSPATISVDTGTLVVFHPVMR